MDRGAIVVVRVISRFLVIVNAWEHTRHTFGKRILSCLWYFENILVIFSCIGFVENRG
jgi:hypothetical protein